MKHWLRFPPPLHVLVLLFVLACGGVSLIIKTVVLDQGKIDRYIERESTTAQAQAQSLALILSSPKEDRLEELDALIARMRNFPQLRWSAVCDPQGKVLYSTREEWEGKLLSDVGPAPAGVLLAMATTRRGPTHLVDGRDSVTAVRMVPAETDAPVAFITFAQRDLTRGIAQRMNVLRKETLIWAAMLVAYSLVLWLLLFAFLKWRLRKLYRGSGFAMLGKAAPHLLNGSDEFAEIAGLLGEAEHLLTDIGDSLQEVVWIVTPDLKPIYLSPAFEKIHMRKREEAYLNANAMPQYILKEHRGAVRDAFMAVVEGGSSLNLEYRIQRGDGQIRWVEASGHAVRDADGTLQRIIGITRDITEQKALQEELVNVSDQERHSLGHDLHDDACQRLAAMKMKCEALAIKLKERHFSESDTAAELTNELAETSALLRNIARGLAPVEMEKDGLIHALEKLVSMQESIHEVPCFFHADENAFVENEVAATHLYRIAQEFINNAARHGKPERIDVRLENLQDHIRLTVTNDGRPFQKRQPGYNGMGLKIIRYRASAIGASVDIRPRADGITGTIAECMVPIEACHAKSSGDRPERAGDGISLEAAREIASRLPSVRNGEHAVPP